MPEILFSSILSCARLMNAMQHVRQDATSIRNVTAKTSNFLRGILTISKSQRVF